ncbi:MAG TPA: hypothetical protein PLV45_14700, partial [bacterium]|nr:hypothetical protein [bacterium]
MKKVLSNSMCVLILVISPVLHAQIIDPFFCGDGICEAFIGESADTCPGDCPMNPVVTNAWIDAGPFQPVPSHGDLWLASWAEDGSPDGRLAMTWGDGCGPGVVFGEPECDEWNWDTDMYDAGYFALDGSFPMVHCIEEGGECFRYPAVPDNVSGWPHTPDDDKPAGIIALDGAIYIAFGSPQKSVEEGYLAVSYDWGHTWNIIPGSPWTMESPLSHKSPFRMLMFIQMGKNYEYNTDGYVYGLGIGWGWYWEYIGDSRVYMCRVPRGSVSDYSTYQYYSGMSGPFPSWSDDPDAAAPVDGLYLVDTANAVYHPYLQRFFYLSQFGLYEAINPWGPWILSSRILNLGDDPEGLGYYSVSLMPKDMGPDTIYAAIAGRDFDAEYSMNIVRLRLDIDDSLNPDGLEPESWRPVPINTAVSIADENGNGGAPKRIKVSTRPSSIHLIPDSEMTIQQAVDSVIDGGEIRLASGVYGGAGNVDIRITRPVRIIGDGPSGTCVIDGGGVSGGFYIDAVDSPGVTLKNITVRNCYRLAAGGAVFSRAGDVFLQDVDIHDCGSFFSGGAIGIFDTDMVYVTGAVTDCFAAMTGGAVSNIWQGNFHCQDVEF